MGAESATLEKDTESSRHETSGHPAGGAASAPACDPFVERIFHGAPSDPSGSAARSLSTAGLKALVLQRAQRIYGNRASQQIVMRARVLQRQCACGGTCDKCRLEEEQRALQRKPASGAAAEFGGIPASQGAALEAGIRTPLESHFQADLSGVRVHTGPEAAESARNLDAIAYTSGRDIYFASGTYAPSSTHGQRLLAHEVAHVVQQSAGKEPAIAMKSAGGVKIGAPEDGLEAEADRAAEDFMPGGQSTGLSEEDRDRRESQGVVQRVIQRQPASGSTVVAGPTPSTSTDATSANPPLPPVPQGEIVKTFDGVPLVEDREFMRNQLEQLVVRGWGDSHYRFLMRLERDCEIDEMAGDRAFKKQYEENPSGVSAGVPRTQEDFDAYDQAKEKERRVLEIVRPLVGELDQERATLIANFETAAKDRARATLDESEKQERSEAIRYGIDWKTVETMRSDCMLGDCKDIKTTYSMGGQSPAVTGLQGAAQVLLGRRKELDSARDGLDQARRESLDNLSSCAGEGGGSYDMDCPGVEEFAKRRETAEQELKKKQDAFDVMHGYLSEKYPILAVFSDPEKSTSDLEHLIDQEAGPGMAALLGKEIVNRLTNIAKVRDGLNNTGEVNIWRLPDLMGITEREIGVRDKPVWQKWIDEKVEHEQPGIFAAIALAVLNIGALLLAPVTAGASLLVAAGVNAVVAVQHIKEYEMQKALTGTAFDRAHALSRDDPSLFWLAVEIVGVAIDFAAAFKAVSSAVKAFKAAEETGDALRIAKARQNLTDVAKAKGGDELVTKVLAGVSEEAGTEGKVVKALGATEKEADLLKAGSAAAKEELEAGVVAGKAAQAPVKVSRAGHIFVCHSPCDWMLERYADLLGSDITLSGETSTLRAQYRALEEEAVKLTKAAEIAVDSSAEGAARLAEAEKSAELLLDKIAAFDQKLAGELAYSQAAKKFGLLPKDAVAKLAQLDKSAAIRLANLDADALSRIASLDADALQRVSKLGTQALKKFGDLPEGALKNLARLDQASLEAIGDLEPSVLGRLENAENLDISARVGSGEPWRGSGKTPEWGTPKGKVYRHVVSDHGAGRTAEQVLDRMRNTGQAQGIWRTNDLIVEAEKLAPPFKGRYIIDMGKDAGDVYELDRTITKAVTKFFLRRGADGELISAYPISSKFTGW